jgi:7-cyano-7-deazaguanine synthase
MYDLVILYSGGADSRLMLESCKELDLNPFCLMIDYEQLHPEELKFAKSHLEEAGIDSQTVKISGLDIDSGLTGDGVKDETGDVHEMHVPGRNTMFLSIAYSIAESKGVEMIWIGSDWDDRLNLFPDCYQEYIVAMNEAFKVAGPNPIEIQAPLSGLSKENIIKMLKKRGIGEHEIFSGYGDL